MSRISKAIIYDQYGKVDVLKCEYIPITHPREGQLLVQVHAVALNPKDYLVRKGYFSWLTRGGFPKIPGLDFAGTVVEVGPDVDIEVGTPVYGSINEFATKRGTLSEFLLIHQSECATKPNALTFEEAAAIPLAGQTALQGLQDKIHLKCGQRIALLGASGGVGVYAIQIAKAIGAHITTTSSPSNFELCKSLGADITLDYKVDNVFANQYDAIFDCYGNQSFAKAAPALTKKGIYVTLVPSKAITWDYLKTRFTSQKAQFFLIISNTEDLNKLAAMVESKQLKPIIDSVYSFKDFAEAFKRIESRHAHGKVIISFK